KVHWSSDQWTFFMQLPSGRKAFGCMYPLCCAAGAVLRFACVLERSSMERNGGRQAFYAIGCTGFCRKKVTEVFFCELKQSIALFTQSISLGGGFADREYPSNLRT